MKSPKGYSRLQISLHWIMLLLIVAQFVLHDPIAEAWGQFLKGVETPFNPLIAQHVFGGGLIAILAIWRLVLRAKRGVPALPAEESAIQKSAAHATHFGLYALMILMPISGSAAWFGGILNAANVHFYLKFAVLGLVALHVLAVLYHQYVLKNNLLRRMMAADKD